MCTCIFQRRRSATGSIIRFNFLKSRARNRGTDGANTSRMSIQAPVIRSAQLRIVMADGLEHRFSVDHLEQWPAPLRALVPVRLRGINVWHARLHIA